MWHKGAGAVSFLCFFLSACGARTPDLSAPDGGATDSGATSGAGGTAGNGGATGKAGAGGSGVSAGTSGSGGATAGSAGTGGTDPGDGGPGPYVTRVQAAKVAKIDLLFMIDNSSSMADKQSILATAVPQLVDRLIEPKCVDPVTGRIVGQTVSGVCAVGVLAFEPVQDIHIGIISSSIGNHGAGGVCEDNIDISLGRSDPHNNDQAHLIARGVGGTNVPTFNNKGFLNYNPAVAGGLATAAAVATPFTDMVKGVGQHGCGYEATLEAVYRFLIDPEPYATIRIDTSIGGFGQAILTGTDTPLLQQRQDFLRPDSLVSIVLVTDENDCSVVDGGQGFYALLPPVAGTGRSVLKPGTSKCIENPNDKCCFNCGQQSPPAGCSEPSSDPECMKGEILVSDDQPNLRCFNQKRRYGVDFLYPVQRYIDGFTLPQVPNRKGEMVRNPLFSDLTCPASAGCPAARDRSLVWVTGILGVPWQDIAVDSIDLTKGYKTAKQLGNDGVWADIVGDPLNAQGPVPPRDTHMVESIKPRPGLAGPGSNSHTDMKHGHEWDPSKDMAQPNADLQYACIFDLVPPKTCTEAADCDCFGPNIADVQNPLCQNAQGAYTSTQARAKAYPSPRILQVLQGLDDQAIVGSICPAQVVDTNREDFGYVPVVNTLLNRLRRPLGSPCLPIALPVDAASGQTPCAIVEVFDAASCPCDNEPARRTATDALLTDEMRAQGACRCEILQIGGAGQNVCRSQLNPPSNSGDGWCYVDPSQSMEATCDVVRTCLVDEKRRIRFVNPNSEPRPGATAYLRCEVPPIDPLPNRCP
ncbi:MAG TPA: hypothetical protein VK550_07455 [Polyangiaceae bacterium]|nr:hypothetical protein [Polyangiaceae bacterium]